MEIKLEEFKQMLTGQCDKATIERPNGEAWIVIADRGFVWVGTTTANSEYCRIENARNIRVWGTTEGLGELRDGPTDSTKLDAVGTVLVPMRAVIGFIKCTRNW